MSKFNLKPKFETYELMILDECLDSFITEQIELTSSMLSDYFDEDEREETLYHINNCYDNIAKIKSKLGLRMRVPNPFK